MYHTAMYYHGHVLPTHPANSCLMRLRVMVGGRLPTNTVRRSLAASSAGLRRFCTVVAAAAQESVRSVRTMQSMGSL